MQVHYDREKLEADGMTVREDAKTVTVSFPDEDGAFMVERTGDDVILLPERSAAHRRIAASLGAPETKHPSIGN